MAARTFVACVVAAALAAAPAAAAPAAPLPAPERAAGSELRGDPAIYVLPLLIVIALLIAILAGEEDPRTSP